MWANAEEVADVRKQNRAREPERGRVEDMIELQAVPVTRTGTGTGERHSLRIPLGKAD